MGRGGQRPACTTSHVATSLDSKRLPLKERTITLKELGKHTSADSCWIAIDRKVFDVTQLLPVHPGGGAPILSVAGREVSDIFHAFHPAAVGKYHLKKYHIGELEGESGRAEVTPMLEAYHELYKELVADGMFNESRGWFVGEVVRLLCILLTAVALVVFSARIGGEAHAFSVRLVGAVVMGMAWQQIAFIGHDLGHSAVTYNRRRDHMIGAVLGNLAGGVSIGWWKDSHYQHHVCTNSVTHDPDIQHPPVFAVSTKLVNPVDAKPVFSQYHKKPLDFSGLLPRFLVSYQHLLLYPIILCARVNLYIQSFMYLLELGPFATRTNNPHKAMELVCLVGFFVYQGLVWSTIPSAYEAAICCAVAHVVSGILHVQIVLSHFSVPTYDGVKYGNPAEGVGPTKHETWAGVQFATTLNITCPSWMDWFHGGLHYQTEHHLFPKMPRHNLRAASSRVRDFAHKHGLPYNTLGFFDANCHMIRHMRKISCSVGDLWSDAVAG